MNTLSVLKSSSAVILLLALIPTAEAFSSPEDYHPVTGEPKCTLCHTPERSYSIDYTRESSCLECHGPGLSDNYISINNRYRPHDTIELAGTMAREKLAAKK